MIIFPKREGSGTKFSEKSQGIFNILRGAQTQRATPLFPDPTLQQELLPIVPPRDDSAISDLSWDIVVTFSHKLLIWI